MNVDSWWNFVVCFNVRGNSRYPFELITWTHLRAHECKCVYEREILTVSLNWVNLQNTASPCSGFGCYGDAWNKNILSTNQKLLWKVNKRRCYLQNDEGGEIGERVVWDVCDLIEGQRHGLQGGQRVQGCDGDLCERVVIQPQVSQRANPSEGPGRNLRQEVSVKTPAGREELSLVR